MPILIVSRIPGESPQQDNTVAVSVVVPTYTRGESLGRLLRQLLSQDAHPFHYEIIVVDDGSPDPVESAVGSIGIGNSVAVRCIRTANRGPASARNLGASVAVGQLLLFVDDDMSVRPDFVQVHLNAHRRFPRAAVSCDCDRQVLSGPIPFRRWCTERMASWRAEKFHSSRSVGAASYEIPYPALTTANLSIRKTDFEAIGGFDTGYPFGCEDQDFGARMELYGIRPLLTLESSVTHFESNDHFKAFCLRQEKGARDTVRFVRRFRVAELHGEPAIARMGGPITAGDPLSLSTKKIVRRLIAAPIFSSSVFAAISLLERAVPSLQALQRAYDLVTGAYIQKGWREGLKLHGAAQPIVSPAPGTVEFGASNAQTSFDVVETIPGRTR